MKKKIYHLIAVGSILSFGFFSCEDMLEVRPDKALESDQAYQNVHDADAAVIGIYGKFLGLAEQYIILNELRADLMDVTANANLDLRALNTHSVQTGNAYASVKPFYQVILYCNDALKNFDKMLAENKFEIAEYNERYSDIGAIRSWVYLQLAIHWGEVPYITEPFENVSDLKNLDRFPKLTLEQMIPTLIEYMESLPTTEMYSINSSLRGQVDTYNPRLFFINKKFFLGDLYLWNGEYTKAANMYRDVMETPGIGDVFDVYKVKYAEVQSNNDLAVGYIRFKEQDYFSLIDNNFQGWKSMFIRDQDNLFNTEWIWVLPFESRFNQRTPFVDLFSNIGGDYLVKPSQLAIDHWNSQTQRNGFPWDQRGRFTYNIEGGQPVIKKHIYNYNLTAPLEKNGRWFLARAALLHLRFAEAANRDEKMRLAAALLNNGISTSWDPTPGVANRDVTNIQNTLHYPAPYNFDARNGQVPFFRGPWHRNAGIRGRAYVNFVDLSSPTPVDSVITIENALINEAALELAYEGHRWGDLLRIALRRTDPAFLANKVADKLQKAGNPEAEAVRTRLMDRSNWFLPFSYE